MADAARKTLSLDELVASGIDVGGRAADRIKIRVPGVGWMIIALPLGEVLPNGEPDDDSELTPTQRRIMAVLEKSKEPMTRRAIANRIGRETVGGKFSQYVSDLVSRGLLFEHAGEVADDSRKFKTP